MSSDIYFNVTSWFLGNVPVKPHHNTKWGVGGRPPPPDLKIFLRPCSGVDDGITFAWRLFEGEQQKTCCYETKQNINVLYCLMYCKFRPICSIRISLIIVIFVKCKNSYVRLLTYTMNISLCSFGNLDSIKITSHFHTNQINLSY